MRASQPRYLRRLDHGVVELHHAVGKAARRLQVEINRAARGRDQRNSLANERRNGVDDELVNLARVMIFRMASPVAYAAGQSLGSLHRRS
jgi:hypothetical protein